MKLLAIPLLFLLSSISPSSALFWYFKPYTSQSNCLTVPGNSNSDLTTLSIAACAGSSYQKFGSGTAPLGTLLTFQTGQSMSCSNKCLDVVGGTGNGVTVTQQDCNPGRLAQWWQETNATGALPGYYWYKNLATGRCMTAESLGTYVDQWDCSLLQLHQIWGIGNPSSGGYPLQNQQYATNCLAVKGGSPLNGAGTETALCSSTAYSQAFNIVANTPNTWTIQGSGKCMDGGGGAQQTYQYTCAPSARNHQWLAVSYPNEGAIGAYYYYVDLLSGLCLTWDPNNLNNVRTQTCTQGNTNQQWLITLA